ncbi:MAG: AMP-binding protein [bacterium]
MSIGNIVARNAIQYRDREALVFEGQRYTWGHLNDRVNRLAGSLLGLGLKKGDKVALLSENHPAAVELNFALAKAGLVFFPVNARLLAPDIRDLIRLSDSRVLVYGAELYPLVKDIRQGLPGVEKLIQVGGETPADALDYEAFLRQGGSAEPDVEVDGEDLYILLGTGGTTGTSKLGMLTHANALWAIYTTVQAMNLSVTDTGIQVLPLFHVIINSCLNSLMAAGARVVLQRRFDPVLFMKNLHDEKVTVVLVVPPFLFGWILAVPEAIRYDVSHVRAFATAAASFPRDLKEAVRAHMPNAEIFYTYGLTESSGGNATVLPPALAFAKEGSIGVVNPILRYRIVTPGGRPAGTGEPGELLLKGPSIIRGYYNRPDETQATFRGGWLHTGDVVRQDGDGFLYFVDRVKDMIKTGGENVFAKEVEDALLTHPDVQEAAVFGVADPKWGEKVCAAVVLKPGRRLVQEDLLAYAAGKLPGYKRPKVISVVEALPRNPSGKVLKSRLKETLGRGT